MQRLPAGAPQFGHHRSITITLPSTAGGGGLRAGDIGHAVCHDAQTGALALSAQRVSRDARPGSTASGYKQFNAPVTIRRAVKR